MSGENATTGRRSRTLGRIAVAIMLIVSISVTALTRQWAIDSHAQALNFGRNPAQAGVDSSASTLNAMPSFATALLLGGLRGPLVMILWIESESQKQQHNLEDFDTMIEWIRLLQPEFDTVHKFQIWNKAYNVSVLMADQANKYTTILDAVDYGQKVDQERPDDINILIALAGIYGDKLGTSQEHPFYRRQVRKETQTRYWVRFPTSREKEFSAVAAQAHWTDTDAPLISNAKTGRDSVLLEWPVVDLLKEKFTGDVIYEPETRRVVRSEDPTWRRLRLDPMLDVNGKIFPDLLVRRYSRPQSWPANKPFYDGSQLQFLAKYKFPYGISTLALAFNEYKRAQLLQRDWNERDIQTSDTVVDSRPAIYLKLWAKDEWERARRAELRMWNRDAVVNFDPDELELPMEWMKADATPVDSSERERALYGYKLAAELFVDSEAEFENHVQTFPFNAQTYMVHIMDTKIGQALMKADYDYLASATAGGAEKESLKTEAIAQYQLAASNAALTGLMFYTDDQIAEKIFPIRPMTTQRFNRANLEQSDPNGWIPLFGAVVQMEHQAATDENGEYHRYRDSYGEDRKAYEYYVERSLARVHLLQGGSPPATMPATAAPLR